MTNVSENTAKLSEDLRAILNYLSEIAEYWEKSRKFIFEIEGRDLSYLSKPQLDWYYQIKDNLQVEYERREARRAFGYPVDNYKLYMYDRGDKNRGDE